MTGRRLPMSALYAIHNECIYYDTRVLSGSSIEVVLVTYFFALNCSILLLSTFT